jgi:hypothetical protein
MQYHMTISGQDLQNNLTNIGIKVNQTNISGAMRGKQLTLLFNSTTT